MRKKLKSTLIVLIGCRSVATFYMTVMSCWRFSHLFLENKDMWSFLIQNFLVFFLRWSLPMTLQREETMKYLSVPVSLSGSWSRTINEGTQSGAWWRPEVRGATCPPITSPECLLSQGYWHLHSARKKTEEISYLCILQFYCHEPASA